MSATGTTFVAEDLRDLLAAAPATGARAAGVAHFIDGARAVLDGISHLGVGHDLTQTDVHGGILRGASRP